MIVLSFVLRLHKGCCNGNQLIWFFCIRRIWLLPVFALTFRKRMQYRHLLKGIDTAAISYEKLVNFGAVTPEITFLIVYVYLHVVIGQSQPTISIRHAGVGRSKCWWARLKQRWTNLVGLCPVSLQLIQLTVYSRHRLAISIRVNSSTFTRNWIEQGLMSHQTHYRSYRGRVLRDKRPNQSKHWRKRGPKD